MATASKRKLDELKNAHSSVHGKSSDANEIQNTLATLTQSLQRILGILATPSNYTAQELNSNLDAISHIFRTVKFSTVLLPLLTELSTTEGHQELWRNAKIGATNMPLTPKSFENIRQSIAPTKDAFGIETPAIRERELALLGIYGITMGEIGEAFLQQRSRKVQKYS